MLKAITFFSLLSMTAVFAANPLPRIDLTETALKIHHSSLLVDGHNDLPWALRDKEDLTISKYDLSKPQPEFHTDIPRLKKGNVGAQFWSVYVPVSAAQPYAMTLEQIEVVRTLIKKYPTTFEFAGSSSDLERIYKAGRIASMIGVEGGHSIENSLDKLRDLYSKGARYMTLTHSRNTSWADSCTDTPKSNGLSRFGEEVVAEMNRLGMFVDISHISAQTMRHVLRVTKAPVIASHSSAYAVKQHPRNVPDDVLKLMKDNGGVIMVNFYSDFVCQGNGRDARAVRECTVRTVVDHIHHIAKTAGVDHVGIGSDFDGVPTLPEELSDVSYYPYITQELLNRGYAATDIKKILGENLMRAFKKMEQVSRDLR